MKTGDKGFCSNAMGVNLYFEVSEISDKGIVLHVINGAWDMHIDIVDVPNSVSGDYNAALDWRRNHRQLEIDKREEEERIAHNKSLETDEIAF